MIIIIIKRGVFWGLRCSGLWSCRGKLSMGGGEREFSIHNTETLCSFCRTGLPLSKGHGAQGGFIPYVQENQAELTPTHLSWPFTVILCYFLWFINKLKLPSKQQILELWFKIKFLGVKYSVKNNRIERKKKMKSKSSALKPQGEVDSGEHKWVDLWDGQWGASPQTQTTFSKCHSLAFTVQLLTSFHHSLNQHQNNVLPFNTVPH